MTGKKWLAGLLAMCLLAGVTPVSAAAGSELPADAAHLSATAQTVPLTAQEIATLQSGGKITGDTVPVRRAATDYGIRKSGMLPASFDLRAEGLTTAIGDQQVSGPCWAFAATAAMEPAWLERNAAANLSEAHLSWFAYGLPDQYTAYKELFDAANNPDIYQWGGNTLTPVYSMSNWIGPADETQYPYGDFAALSDNAAKVSKAHLQDALLLPIIDWTDPQALTFSRQQTAEVKQMMLTYGTAISVGYCAGDGANDYNDLLCSWYNETAEMIDHGVAIVGWDDSYNKSNFKHSEQISGNGAWLIKNSWGADWGDNGYFWMSYEDKSLIVDGVYLFEENNNYDHLYSYDQSVFVNALQFNEGDTERMANIFTADTDQLLEAASFYTSNADVAYTVRVYTNLTDPANPASGTLAATVSGTEAYWGYHTQELSAPVALAEGQRFAIVVELTDTGSDYPLYMEAAFTSDPDNVTLCEEGESFIYDMADGQWYDMYGTVLDIGDGYSLVIANCPIKAFTVDAPQVTYSENGGSIPFGSTVSLSACGNPDIYYTTDGSDPTVSGIRYTEPVTIDRALTLRAVTKTGGVWGDVKKKTYSQTKAALTSLLINSSGNFRYWSLDNRLPCTLKSPWAILTPLGAGQVTVGCSEQLEGQKRGVELVNGLLTVQISVTRDGCAPTDYLLRLTQSGIAYDYEQEKLLFNPNDGYTVKDEYGAVIEEGASLTAWLDGSGKDIQVTRTTGGDHSTTTVKLLPREAAPALSTDGAQVYRNKLSLPDTAGWEYRLGEDGAWTDTPTFTGLTADTAYTVYARKAATLSAFASAATSAEFTTKALVAGDVNGDGNTGMPDALMLYRIASQRVLSGGDEALAADYNGDGNVDMRDAMAFYRVISGRV